jgi:hypothetical protein
VTLPVGIRQISQAAAISSTEQLAAGLRPLIAAAAMLAFLMIMRGVALADQTPLLRLVFMLPAGILIYGLMIALIDRRETQGFVKWIRAK